MARFDVAGPLTTVGNVSTHALGQPAQASLSVGGVIGVAPDTTAAGAVGVGLGSFAVNNFRDRGVVYAARFGGSSAKSFSTLASQSLVLASTGSSGFAQTVISVMNSTSLERGSSEVAPLAMALIGGDELALEVSTVTGVSTVASTQAVSFSLPGFGGVTPNTAVVLGQSNVSSVANFSFGFACRTSDGTIKQWSIDQSGREGAVAQVTRNASTISALALHTTGSTAHDVSVTSFRSSGLELTVNATDTARPATISVLGLKVPRVDAGKATITTNGAGTGQTGFTVSDLGQSVGLVIMASIGSSLQTLQADNMFSIGFASSNGNQRAVSGMVTQSGGASTRFASYFGTSHAVIFVSGSSNVHPSITAPPAVVSKGVFSLDTASSGFKVTFDNTAANGWDVYWAALQNVVTDIGGSIQSNFNANAGPKEVGHIGGSIVSSLNANAGVNEVGHLGGQIQAAFTEALGLTPDFFPGEGKYHADAEVRVRNAQDASWGLGNGSEEASDRYLTVMKNSSSPDLNKTIDVTTDRTRLGIAEFGNARFLRIVPPSTNTIPLRLSGGRSGSGMQLSSRGMSVLSLADRAGSDAYLFTTSEGTTIAGVRVLLD